MNKIQNKVRFSAALLSAAAILLILAGPLAGGMIFGVENGLKVSSGEFDGLKSAGIMEKKAAQEDEFRKLIDENPKWKAEYADAWGTIAAAIEKQKPRFREMSFHRAPVMRLGNSEFFGGRFFYDGTANRTVSVHSAAMIEALKKIYGAGELAREILGEK